MGGFGDWIGQIMIGLGALLLVLVVGFLTVAVVVLFLNAVT